MSISRDALRNVSIFGVVAVLVLIGLAGFGRYQYVQVSAYLKQTREQLAASESHVEVLQEDLKVAEEELRQEKAKMDAFQREIEGISGAVGILQRLQGTDRELLQKYSRTYFLSENYIPEEIAAVSERYLYSSEKTQWMHVLVKPYLERMIEAAASANVDFEVVSGYRSFREQSLISERHEVVFGRDSNKFSAEQGYSEHQLGTTVDFTTSGLSDPFEGFENTRAYEWLSQNAYQYGFVLSYPEGNPYYIFEPWHWRYVGIKLASFLHDQHKNFYDFDQKEIDEYLLELFVE